MSVRTIADLVGRLAARGPRPALIDAATDEVLGGAPLADRIAGRAAALVRAGVRHGDHVALLLPNSPAMIECLLAVSMAGAAAVPVNLRWRRREVDHLLADAAPRLLVADPELLRALGPLAHQPVTATTEDVTTANSAHLPAHPKPTDPALVLYTSGTTGRPKGAVLTHANLLSNARRIVDWLGMQPDDRVLTVMPLFHANAIVIGTLVPLLAGGATIVADAFHASTFWNLVARHRPTTAGTVPTMLTLLRARDDRPPPDCSLRFLLTGSAPVPADVVSAFESDWGVRVIEGYGLTECTCRATFNPIDGRHRPGSCGLPLEELRIVDAQDRPVARGTVGEIVIRGPHVMREYLGNPTVTAQVLRDGWLHSGDFGRQDTDGFVYVLGRASDMIIRGGENVYPREIEDTLYRHPDVADAAAVGAPDPIYGEVIVAFIVARPGRRLAPGTILAWCRERLADYKCPVAVHVETAPPKGPTGKILKADLRERLVRT